MTIEAVVGTPVVQTLAYQVNHIESIYNQDCGDYSYTITPFKPFLALGKSGANLNPHSRPYIDQLTLASNSPDDIGVYTFEVTVQQDLSNPSEGYN